MINDTSLNEVNETNFLVVILSYNLFWKKQINEIVKKLDEYWFNFIFNTKLHNHFKFT